MQATICMKRIARLLVTSLAITSVFLVTGELSIRLLWAPPSFHQPQVVHEKHERLGWTMKPQQTGYMMGIPASINEFGLRGNPISLSKPPNKERILVLGDSNTFGYLTEDENVYPFLLERQLNAIPGTSKFEVINAGHQRYAPSQQLDYLQLYGMDFQPDTLVVGVYRWRNLYRGENWDGEFESPKEKYVQRLWEKYPRMMWLVKNSAVITLARDRLARVSKSVSGLITYGKAEKLSAEKLNQFNEDFQRYYSTLLEFTSRNEMRLILVYLPHADNVRSRQRDERGWAFIEEFSRRSRVEAIDMFDAFVEAHHVQLKELYFPYNDHFTSVGHQLVAQELLNLLATDRTGSPRR